MQSTTSTPSTKRLFIALWPDEAERRALCALRDAWRWPKNAAPMRAERLHITLHFLGEQPASLVQPLREGLARLAFEPFDLRLARTAVWHNGVAVAEPEPGDVPDALEKLHAGMAPWLASLGYTAEQRPYRPHVTLARRAGGATPPPSMTPIRWRAARPVLVWSDSGPPLAYRVL